MCTLCISQPTVSLTDGDLLIDLIDYQSVGGEPQYLDMTGPDSLVQYI